MHTQSSEQNAKSELSLLKWFLISSLCVHILCLCFDPSLFFFQPQKILDEGSIDIDLISLDTQPNTHVEPPPLPPAPLLPQVPKRFDIERPEKPEDLALEEKKAPAEEEPKIQIDHQKDEEATKIALERLIKEVNRQKTKEKSHEKPSLLSDNLKERKKELETEQLHGILSIGTTKSGYASVVKVWIQRNYALPEIYELKNTHIKAVVELVLSEQGGIAKLSLVSSSQNPIFDQLALKTVEKAAPFPTPPPEWVGKVIVLPFETKLVGQ